MLQNQGKAYVKNASDRNQVKNAKQKEESKRDNELNDLRSILNTPAGRRVLWRFISYAKIFQERWEPSAKIHYDAGVRAFGLHIIAEINEASEDLFIEMMKENKKD